MFLSELKGDDSKSGLKSLKLRHGFVVYLLVAGASENLPF